MAPKTVLVLASPGPSTNILYHALKDAFSIPEVILEQPLSKSDFLRRRVRKLGLSRVVGQVAFASLVLPMLRCASRARVRDLLRQHNLCDAPITGIPVRRVPSVNSDETIALLRRLNPDLVVINGTRIIAQRILDSIPATFVNMHAGITPRYRGVHGGYWALVARDEEHCGVTVHLVDRGIDTGGILAQAVIRPLPEDNFVTYPILQVGAGLPLLKRVVREVLEGQLAATPEPEGPSRLWVHPTLFEYLNYRLGRGVR
jgi:folate-dependent phosphoribosylglycinamide formyltransferase PurN